MAGKQAPHVREAVRMVLAGKTLAEARAATECSERALRMGLRSAGQAPLSPGRKPAPPK